MIQKSPGVHHLETLWVHDLEGVRLRSANIFLLTRLLNFFSGTEYQ